MTTPKDVQETKGALVAAVADVKRLDALLKWQCAQLSRDGFTLAQLAHMLGMSRSGAQHLVEQGRRVVPSWHDNSTTRLDPGPDAH